MTAAVLSAVWIIGFVATLIFAHYRLVVNTRAGFITDPYDPIGYIGMLVKCVIWPYTMPMYYLLYRASKKRK